jgi:hypothetical protein
MKTMFSRMWAVALLYCRCLAAVRYLSSFQLAPSARSAAVRVQRHHVNTPLAVLLLTNKKDAGSGPKSRGVGSSGYKTDRLNKLAELDEDRVETDKSFVLKAAGGFVAFLVLLLVLAFTSGVLDQI